jgi:aspartyl-tRNA(Asn)/glutamyl-tRNA(Gln) amidotransferase subunit A
LILVSQETTLTAAHLADGVAAGDLSAGELLKAALELGRTEGRRLNAFIILCQEKALRQAQQIDRKVKAGGPVGPLAGVPVAIKDNICYSGYPTTCASHILEGFVPPYDATVVTKLIDAGAIIIGKTNLDEFAMGSSNETSYYGPAKSPVGDDLVPGGSSGGSAAAVAAGIVPIALGSDTGGSIRQPAAFCGIYGLKPTYGAVSRYGLVAYGSSLDQIGLFARNVKDLALAYKVVAGHDPSDSTSVPYEHPEYSELLEPEKSFKIGVPKEFFTEGLDPEIDAGVKQAIRDLQEIGHIFIDISLPLTDKAIATYYTIVTAEASSNLARYDGVRYGLRESGDKDLATMYTDTRTAGFGPEVKRRIMLGTFVLSSGYYDQYYAKASRVRELFRRDFDKAFSQVDLIISPTTPTPAFKFGDKLDDPLTMYLSDIYTVLANLVGIPAISVPHGKTSDGRPVGIQFMAPHFGELSLFEIAFALEGLS